MDHIITRNQALQSQVKKIEFIFSYKEMIFFISDRRLHLVHLRHSLCPTTPLVGCSASSASLHNSHNNHVLNYKWINYYTCRPTTDSTEWPYQQFHCGHRCIWATYSGCHQRLLCIFFFWCSWGISLWIWQPGLTHWLMKAWKASRRIVSATLAFVCYRSLYPKWWDHYQAWL